MPAYPIPPWLRPPPDPGEEYVQSFQAGAHIAQAQAQLAQSAARADVEAQAQRAAKEREFQMEQQRIEVGKQYQQLQIGLRKQQLDQAGQIVQMRTQEAARKFQAHQKYKALINEGMDPAKALLEVGPDLGISMTGAAQLYRQTLPQSPPEVRTTPMGHEYLFNPRSGATHTFGAAGLPGSVSAADKLRLSELQKQRAFIEKMDVSNPAFLLKANAAKKEGETALQAAGRLKDEELSKVQRQIDAVVPGGTKTATSGGYSSPNEVKAAVKSGQLTRQQGLQILKDQFGFE